MLVKERHTWILKMLNDRGSVSTSELINTLGVSFETIRRDLLELEKQGALQRVHGGAVLENSEMKPYVFDLSVRKEDNKNGKKELCEYAATFVNDDDVIGMDVGSTAVYFAEVLIRKFSRLTVVTNSLEVFNILQQKEGFRVILCGGYYMKSEGTFYGQITIDTLKNLRVQKGFLFPSAISLRNGVVDFDYDQYPIQMQIMACSNKVFFLADSSKFEKNALLKLCDMKSKYTFVTDSGLNPEYKQLYEDSNLKVISSWEDIQA